MIRIALVVLGLLVSATISGCGHAPTRHYYTLSYPVPPKQFEKPEPVTVRFKPLSVRATYRTKNVVYRPDVHEIRFYKTRRWSEAPKKMLSTITRDHLVQSGLFKSVVKSVGLTPPKFTFTGELEVIEELEAGGKRFARLAITYQLIDYESDQVVWSHRFDTRRPVGAGTTRGTARAMSQIMALELHDTFERLSRHLQGLPPREEVASKGAAPLEADVIGPDPSGPPVGDEQLLGDDTKVPIGYGAVFVPASLDGNRESLVVVYEGRIPVAEGRPGKRIVLRPGRYTLHIGSGATSQQIRREVHVADSLTTYVPRSWSGLVINVVDSQFVPYRNQYELVRMDTREDFGLGFGADAQQGEKVAVWVLKPGLYKIIQSGGTYRDRVNFATVRLEEGRTSRFTLVIDADTGDFLGAGEADPRQTIADTTAGGWHFRGVLGGNLLFNRTNQVAEQEGWSLEGNLFFDGSGRYAKDQHNWYTRFELEEGQLRPAGEDAFRNQADRLFFHTIYTYQLYKRFGPYARFGLETKLVPRYENFDENVNVIEEDGTVVESDVDRVEIASSFQPAETKQGVGGNFLVLRNRRAELNLRLGLGLLQSMNSGVYTLSVADGAGPDDPQIVTRAPVDDNFTYGFEGTVVGRANLLRVLTVSTELDALAPFSENDETIFSWRNRIGLRLSSFVSLVYRFNASQNPNIGDEVDDVKTEHDVQLRFSYTLF